MGEGLFWGNGKEFFPLGLQCCNSSAYSRMEMERFWQCVDRTGVNSVEIPVYWEEFEKEEGKFDYKLLEEHVDQAKQHRVKLLLVWFGTWKNGTSKFAPQWVRNQRNRFTRVISYEGIETNILSPYCRENLEADKKAFVKLAEYAQKVNEKEADNVIIGIQVENEPGMMMRGYRDHSQEADIWFNGEIPEKVKTLLKTKDMGEVTDNWKKSGQLDNGTWKEVFGRYAEEYFSVYGIASYINEIAEAGKEITSLPFSVNVWVDRVGWDEPGADYPAGGPVSKVLGLWKALTPAIDVIGLDNYKLALSEYCMDCQGYAKYGNPLFLPETHAWEPASSRNMFWALGKYKTQGIFFFGPEAMIDEDGHVRAKSVDVWNSLKAMTSLQSVFRRMQKECDIQVIYQEEDAIEQRIVMDDTYIRIGFNSYERTDYHHGYFDTPCGYGKGLLIRENQRTFYAVGDSFCLSIRGNRDAVYFRQKMDKYVDYECVEEGYFDREGRWQMTRIRNGDESDYGIWVTYDCGTVKIIVGGGEYERL